MKILQIASFDGNIGDIANHNGFRNSLIKKMGSIENIQFTNLEMRKFYKNWNDLSFDENFVNYANEFDLVVFGGGGFFELKWEYSVTGTTINISNELLEKIKPPIIFNCIGTTMAKGASKNTIKKFKNFIDYCIHSKKILFTVRNDGSLELIKTLYGDEYAKKVIKVPDGGFFIKPKEFHHSEIAFSGENYIAVNIASDMPDIRFSGKNGLITKNEFILKFGEFINIILNKYENYRIVFIPHIFKDYELISEISNYIEDKLLRTRVSCAPCLNGTITDGLYNFDLYKNAKLAIGMRYHANVCPIGMNVPTIGICTIEPHIKLYEDIGLSNRCIKANEIGFEKKLLSLTEYALKNLDELKEENIKVMVNNKIANDKYHEIIYNFLKKNYVL